MIFGGSERIEKTLLGTTPLVLDFMELIKDQDYYGITHYQPAAWLIATDANICYVN